MTLPIDKKREILSNAKVLRESQKFKTVFIQPDLTREEQKASYELRKALRETRSKNPGKQFKIQRGHIVEVTSSPNN